MNTGAAPDHQSLKRRLRWLNRNLIRFRPPEKEPTQRFIDHSGAALALWRFAKLRVSETFIIWAWRDCHACYANGEVTMPFQARGQRIRQQLELILKEPKYRGRRTGVAREVAERLGVSNAAVWNWLHILRTTPERFTSDGRLMRAIRRDAGKTGKPTKYHYSTEDIPKVNKLLKDPERTMKSIADELGVPVHFVRRVHGGVYD